MVASFDFTFLLWACYYAFLVPAVVKVRTENPGQQFEVGALSIAIGAVLGLTP